VVKFTYANQQRFILFVIDSPFKHSKETALSEKRMGKGLCSSLVILLALFLSTRSLGAQLRLDRGATLACAALARVAANRLVPALLHWSPGRLFAAFLFRPQTQDGGGSGDGGGSTDGGSSDGGSTDGSSSDSASTDDGGDAAATAAAAADEAAAAENAVGAPTDPTTDPTTVTQDQEESPLDTIQAQATTDPRGGAVPSSFDTPGGGLGPVPPSAGAGAPPAGPVDITINAVIVSGASSPWHAVQRAPGVRNVTVNGGIIALGSIPLPREPPPGPQPDWLYVNPDPQLVNGSVIPPVVPNIIDIRWLNCPIKVIENLDKQTYDPN
jgi:hypothetical protein